MSPYTAPELALPVDVGSRVDGGGVWLKTHTLGPLVGGMVPQGVSNTSNEAFLPPAGGTRSAIGSITRGPHPSFISKQGQQHFPESS